MSGLILYGIALSSLAVSFIYNRKKSKQALLKAWKSFMNLLPNILSIMIFVGISLAVLSPSTTSSLLGKNSGLLGITIATILGSITLIPGFVAFPLAASLLKAGAGYPQIAAFLGTLMGVGIVTLSTEIKYFSKSTALWRNFTSLIIALVFTFIIQVVM